MYKKSRYFFCFFSAFFLFISTSAFATLPNGLVIFGDSLSDIQFGQNLGMKTVHITKSPYTCATITEDDFLNAARSILKLGER